MELQSINLHVRRKNHYWIKRDAFSLEKENRKPQIGRDVSSGDAPVEKSRPTSCTGALICRYQLAFCNYNWAIIYSMMSRVAQGKKAEAKVYIRRHTEKPYARFRLSARILLSLWMMQCSKNHYRAMQNVWKRDPDIGFRKDAHSHLLLNSFPLYIYVCKKKISF